MQQHRHIGAYGLLEQDNTILLVRKTRGPYRGQLDLPGGGIEFGEEPVSALHREFIEETGLMVASQMLLSAVSHRVRYQNAGGETEDLHHLGLLYRVTVTDSHPLKTEADGEDSGGAIWINRSDALGLALSPFAHAAREHF